MAAATVLPLAAPLGLWRMDGETPDDAAVRLEELAAELQATLATRDAQLAEQCRIAACEEGKVVERRLSSELAETMGRVESLESLAERRSEDLSERSAKLGLAEERLAETAAYERRARELEEQRRAQQTRLNQLEAEHRARAEQLRGDLWRTREQGDEAASLLRRSLTQEEQECERLAESNQSAEDRSATVVALHSRLGDCRRKVEGLEAFAATTRSALVEREAQVIDLLERSAQLGAVAEERDEDAALQSELEASQEQVHDLVRKTSQLLQVDGIASSLEAQLQSSGQLVDDMMAAIAQVQEQVDAGPPPEEPPASWPEDRARLQAQLGAMQRAQDEASEHAVRLQKELDELQRAPQVPPSESPSVSTSVGQRTARLRRLEALRAEAAEGALGIGSGDAKHDNGANGIREEAAERLQHAEARFCQTEGPLDMTRRALDAKGRRIQLLKARTEQAPDSALSAERTDQAELMAEAAAAERRVLDLEALASQLGSQLEERRREVSELRRSRRQEDLEKDTLHAQLVDAQRQRIESLDAQLHGVKSHAAANVSSASPSKA